MIRQATALSWISLKSSTQRLPTSFICIVSIAIVATVILGMLALTNGMNKTMMKSGDDNTLLVMRQGSTTELQSVMFPVEVKILANHSAIKRTTDDQPIYAAELFVNAEYKTGNKVNEASLSLRGISQHTYQFRPNFQLTSGALFTQGLREIIIGEAIARKFPDLQVGKVITLGNSQWTISGIFSDNNSVFESEIWADLSVVQNDYQRGNTIQSVRLALKSNTDLAALKSEWQADPRLNVRAMMEKEFFAEQGENLTRLIRWIGFPVAFIMAIGAVVSALNTMYAVIASRSQEIATHKAIGFSPFAISVSVVIEAILLALLGALIGIVPIYLLFDGWTAATQNADSLSQLVFNFSINIELIGQTLVSCIAIGIIGGLLPAIKVIQTPVSSALAKH